MTDLDSWLAAYEQMRADLEAHHMGKWVVVHDGKLAGTFESFEAAAKDAGAKFGCGPYLIKQVGAPVTFSPVVNHNRVAFHEGLLHTRRSVSK
jgi:hypothetical protein